MGKHDYTKMDRARDELMSHVVRCDVLEARMEDRETWLKETMDYMAERYPQLSDLQLKQLEMIGRQFIKPAIPHGKEYDARARDENIDDLIEVGTVEEAEVEGEPKDVEEVVEAETPTDVEASADIDADEEELQPA